MNTKHTTNETYLSTQDAADILLITPRAVTERIKSGDIRAISNGKRWLIPRTELRLYVESLQPGGSNSDLVAKMVNSAPSIEETRHQARPMRQIKEL